jgi:large repetitive protein
LWTTLDGIIPAGQETEQDPAGLTAGTYNVTVRDENGCIITSTITLLEPTELVADTVFAFEYPGGFNVTCGANDGSVTLEVSGATPPYTYYGQHWMVLSLQVRKQSRILPD